MKKHSTQMGLILVRFALASLLAACTQVEFKTQQQSADGGAAPVSPGGCQSNCDGNPGQAVSDTLVVPVGPKVDILFVVDNSPSMTRELEGLKDRFPDFISSLGQNDWRIGITTTDTSPSGKQGDLLTLTGPGANGAQILSRDISTDLYNLTQIFQSTLQISPYDNGALGARGIYASILSVQKNSGGLIRSSSDPSQDPKLDVIYISDEDELGNGGNSLDYPLDPSRDTFSALYNAVKTRFSESKAKNMRLHGFVIRPGDTACYNRQRDGNDLGFAGALGTRVGHYGVAYTNAILESKGTVNSVCDENYTAGLRSVGQSISDQVFPREQKLRCTPKDNVSVTFTPAANAVPVGVSGSKLVFESVPAPGTQIQLSYTCAG